LNKFILKNFSYLNKMNYKEVLSIIAMLLLFVGLVLEIVSATSYPDKGAVDAIVKSQDVAKYHNMAMVFVVASIALCLMCNMKMPMLGM
jgi:cell division protein FtsW (lipid II flippase)